MNNSKHKYKLNLFFLKMFKTHMETDEEMLCEKYVTDKLLNLLEYTNRKKTIDKSYFNIK